MSGAFRDLKKKTPNYLGDKKTRRESEKRREEENSL